MEVKHGNADCQFLCSRCGSAWEMFTAVTNPNRVAQVIKPEANVNDERLLCRRALNTSHYMMQTTLRGCLNIMLLSFL